jgi:hypothetical protein
MTYVSQENRRLSEEARRQILDLHGFDYTAPAELFPSRSTKGRAILWRHKRFETAAEAIQFAMEEMSGSALVGVYLEVEDAHFGTSEIRFLYKNAAYPLKRVMV